MSITATLYGRLPKDPREITTKTGKPMAVASVGISMDREDKKKMSWINLVAFGDQAADLLLHSKGDSINASGRLQTDTWQAQDGTERENLSMLCDVISSARTERSRAKRGFEERRERGVSSPPSDRGVSSPPSDRGVSPPPADRYPPPPHYTGNGSTAGRFADDIPLPDTPF